MVDVIEELFTHELTMEEYWTIIKHCQEQLKRIISKECREANIPERSFDNTRRTMTEDYD